LAAAAVGELETAELGDFVVDAQGNFYLACLQLDGADAVLAQGLAGLPALEINAQQTQALEDGVLAIDAAVAVVVVFAQLGKPIGRAVLVAKQLAAIIDGAVAVAVECQ
jgi:hypothetical protein